jgi:hypothetical protein
MIKDRAFDGPNTPGTAAVLDKICPQRHSPWPTLSPPLPTRPTALLLGGTTDVLRPLPPS